MNFSKYFFLFFFFATGIISIYLYQSHLINFVITLVCNYPGLQSLKLNVYFPVWDKKKSEIEILINQ